MIIPESNFFGEHSFVGKNWKGRESEMKAMNLCRPLERSLERGRTAHLTECLESIIKAPKTAWKGHLKEIINAARKDERQKMLRSFVKEKKSWESKRGDISRLKDDLKKKDSSINWLKSALEEKECYISKLKEDVRKLEEQIEVEITSRIQNAQSMKKILGVQKTLYPGLLNFGKLTSEVDPFKEVSMDLLRQHKIDERMDEIAAERQRKSEMNECDSDAKSCSHSEFSNSTPELHENKSIEELTDSFLRDE
eukprot:CAMPEP_0197517230 /NCGR_PEP_ID=MMETSP1318-20131121/2221_1 /TAXON_ID=552666 /ORGANISM="Partenskyella glossopodia, Strain RCC365" /LENGTH=251 /DNA_ID=CAMNT_0043066637 /DNA_START=38 /DNA_END=793 /DNA_ORIENTATION=-